MRTLNLGRVLSILVLFILNLHADVGSFTNTPVISRGEIVSFTLTASSEAKFPNINDIEGYPIIATSNSSRTNIINGDMTKIVSRTYTFRPSSNVVVPSFDIEVDGKIESTKPLEITVIEPVASKSGDEFMVEMRVNNSELMIGESTILSLVFKHHASSKIDDFRYEKPNLSGFWVEELGVSKQKIEGEYVVVSMDFLIFPQKSGSFEIPAISAQVCKLARNADPFFGSFFKEFNYENIYSNSLFIEVKPLPDGLSVYGDFEILASVDKKSVNAGEPVNLTITVEGEGNIDDIAPFAINESDLLVYINDPVIQKELKDDIYGGKFSQKFAIIGENNFTIPAVKFTYFDKNLGMAKSIETKPINIEVVGKRVAQSQNLSISTDDDIADKSVDNKKGKFGIFTIITTAIGAFLAGLICFYIFTKLNFKTSTTTITTRIKNSKSDKELFEILLPYANDSKLLGDTLKLLEENLYKKTKHKIDKKELIKEFMLKEL
ncbi:MAG: protein BatD [Campylobacter sp.]|nr:protein BatD [Campylobacter sp.]